MPKDNPKIGERYKYTRPKSSYEGDVFVVKNSDDLNGLDTLNNELVLINEDGGGIWSLRNLFGNYKKYFRPVSDDEDEHTSYEINIEMKITIDEV